jgi:hypothetical protein|tara:strand:+ start:3430 stop:3648 length:219 start_codon:yes stop_codon:yes gene_type:complete
MADPLDKDKREATAQDNQKKKVVENLPKKGGPLLDGDKLAEFQEVYDRSPMIRGMYNRDSSPKESSLKLTEK